MNSHDCQSVLSGISIQFTGQPTIVFYASTIFQALGFQSGEKATLASLGIGFAKVCNLYCLCVKHCFRFSLLTSYSVGNKTLTENPKT